MTRYAIPLALLLAACTPQRLAAVQNVTATIAAACGAALPLANLAIGIPTIGPFVAAGVQVGCATDAGLAKLAADPSSVLWLNQQIGILEAALPATE